VERWAVRIVPRVRRLAAEGSVRFTYKALQELAEFGLDEVDGCEILAGMTPSDGARRQRSTRTGEWMYVFRTLHLGGLSYVKLVIRASCVVVSFHAEMGDLGDD